MIASIDARSPGGPDLPLPRDEVGFRRDLESFVRSYLSLREVEKRVLAESGRSFPPSDLGRAIAAEMLSQSSPSATRATVGSTVCRYGGSARDRASEKGRDGTPLTRTDAAVMRGEACTWCGGSMPPPSRRPGVRSTYCSRGCAEEGRLKRGHGLRAQLFALERGVCRGCGVDARALYEKIGALRSPAERLSALCDANWSLPRTGPALERLLQRPREGDFWQADHVRAVAEGGGECGLDNLRTLCTPCHKTETEKLRARLRLTGGVVTEDVNGDVAQTSPRNNKSGQMDIRSALFGHSLRARSSGRSHARKRQRTPD